MQRTGLGPRHLMPHWSERHLAIIIQSPTGSREGAGSPACQLLPPLLAPARLRRRPAPTALHCIAAMATLTLAPALSVLSTLSSSTSATPHQISSSPFAPLLGANPTTRKNATSLRSQTTLGSWTQSPQRRRWQCQAESVDSNETVAAAGEQKLSQAKESVTEKQGPPVATIIAGVVVAVVVFWGLWSLISFLLGFFFR